MRTNKRSSNNLVQTLLIFGYIAAVLLFSGLARADENLLREVALINGSEKSPAKVVLSFDKR